MTNHRKQEPATPAAASTKPASKDGRSRERILAEMTLRPVMRNATVASSFGSTHFIGVQVPMEDAVAALAEDVRNASAGDVRFASDMLAAQAVTLDTLFTEMARRSGANMGEYFDAADRYMRLALKAQANCRATLEALAKLHQPREQTVRHVHVNEGGQAVIAENFHHHTAHSTGGTENGKAADQPHEPRGAAGAGAALSGPNPLGDAMPVPGDQGPQALPVARRKKPRGAQG